MSEEENQTRGFVDSLAAGEAAKAGEAFKSDSPRRFIQMELILSTEDYNVAPLVRSLSLEYVDALVDGARGSIFPKVAKPNEDTKFSYKLAPDFKSDNVGFDTMRLIIPDLSSVHGFEVLYDGELIPIKTLDVVADSVLISMPTRVVADTVQIDFTTRLVQNSSVIKLDLGMTQMHLKL